MAVNTKHPLISLSSKFSRTQTKWINEPLISNIVPNERYPKVKMFKENNAMKCLWTLASPVEVASNIKHRKCRRVFNFRNTFHQKKSSPINPDNSANERSAVIIKNNVKHHDMSYCSKKIQTASFNVKMDNHQRVQCKECSLGSKLTTIKEKTSEHMQGN